MQLHEHYAESKLSICHFGCKRRGKYISSHPTGCVQFEPSWSKLVKLAVMVVLCSWHALMWVSIVRLKGMNNSRLYACLTRLLNQIVIKLLGRQGRLVTATCFADCINSHGDFMTIQLASSSFSTMPSVVLRINYTSLSTCFLSTIYHEWFLLSPWAIASCHHKRTHLYMLSS